MAAPTYVQNGSMRLYVEHTAPEQAALGHVLIIHGVGEHLGRHQYIANALAQLGYAVTRFDLRGCGRSSGLSGHVDRFTDYFDDIDVVLDSTSTPRTFLLGQSMGGLIATHYALRRPSRTQGLVLCSPCFGLQMEPPVWKKALASVLWMIAPRLQLPNGLPLEGLSHNPEVAQAYRNDPLTNDNVSTKWYAELMRSIRAAHAEAGQLTCPTLVMAGGADPIVSTAATKHLFEHIGAEEKRLVVFPEAYHELLNEDCRAQALTEVENWLSLHR